MEILQHAGERAVIVLSRLEAAPVALTDVQDRGGSKVEKTSLRAKTTSKQNPRPSRWEKESVE